MARAGLRTFVWALGRWLSRLGPTARLKKVRPAPGVSFLMLLDTREEVQRYISIFSTWESEVVAFMVSRLRPGDGFLDAGAHAGFFSLLAARLAGPGSEVHAFEPSPRGLRRLRRNSELNPHLGIRIHPYGLADGYGSERLYLNPGHEYGGDSLSGGLRKRTVEIEVVPLDEYGRSAGIALSAIRMVKLDVEGAELRALGAMETLLSRKPGPDFVFEINRTCLTGCGGAPQEIFGLFTDHGYRLYEMCGVDLYRELHAASRVRRRVANCLATQKPLPASCRVEPSEG
jgi:FkbM family methyltransferase